MTRIWVGTMRLHLGTIKTAFVHTSNTLVEIVKALQHS